MSNGPIVPDKLVQELEDDRVVIFCGAGISMDAGLPSYAGLVSHCYTELSEPLPPNRHPDWSWPDRMLGSLEASYGAEAVRRTAAERLDIAPANLDMHQAILHLARLNRSNGVRLVTTNFDTFFETARPSLTLGLDCHSGPILPIPRNDRIASWRSVVYLHGRLAPADHNNQHLVLTSADFGRAYLTEAWAARFVARLFGEFTVLFIGYSLNDPVLRYMTDAFAAEDALSRTGQPRGPAYIFVPHRKARPDPKLWKDRQLEPIFYNQTHNHVRLKRTLIAWADARQDYLSNTRVMIGRIAPTPPEALDPSQAANLVWAVVGRPDDGGHGARIFADVDPVPPIQWLFELERRDMAEKERHDKAIEEARKADRIPPVSPTFHIDPLFPSRFDERGKPIGDTSYELMRWILKHMDDVRLVDWIIAKLKVCRRPHAVLRRFIRERLAEPNALPNGYRRFWTIVSAKGDWTTNRPPEHALWNLCRALRTERDAPWVDAELAAAIRPWLLLEASFYRTWGTAGLGERDVPPDGSRLRHLAGAEVHLSEDDLPEFIEAIEATPAPDAYWARQLDMLTAQLRRVFDLYAVAGEADAAEDPSSYQRPSIVPHAQNHNHKDWVQLFDLIWRGWKHIDASEADFSRHYVALWQRIPYQGFHRLALAAITHSPHFTSAEKLETLLDV